jgi:hypothetical protein
MGREIPEQVTKWSRTFATDCKFGSAVFWRVHKIVKSDCYNLHVRLSVRTEQLSSHSTDFHEI